MPKYTLTISSDDPAEIAALLPVTVAPVTIADTPVPDVPADDPSPIPAVAGELDIRGYPHDERIHAKTKTKNADGSWRYRRGTEQAIIDAVEAEIKPANDPGPIPPVLQAPAAAPVAVPTTDTPATAPVAVPTDNVVAMPITYDATVNALAEAVQRGAIAMESLPGFWIECGVADASGLNGNQPAIDLAWSKIQAATAALAAAQ